MLFMDGKSLRIFTNILGALKNPQIIYIIHRESIVHGGPRKHQSTKYCPKDYNVSFKGLKAVVM